MSQRINDTFTRIHGHYDFFNHLFSFGLDILWRRDAARHSIISKRRYRVLDVATGTGDLAIAISAEAKRSGKEAQIIGMDFNKHMLEHAEEKTRRLGLKNIRFEYGDALHMAYPDSYFDVVASGFALRNFDSLKVFGREMKRVMKKGGTFVLLDMSKPDSNLNLTSFYFSIIRAIGSIVSKGSYKWLTSSIMNFDRNAAAELLSKQGFKNVRVIRLISGISFIITGNK